MKKEICAFGVLAISVAAFAQEVGGDDNSKLDELGQVPRIHSKFDGSCDSFGEESVKWDLGRKSRPEWAESRNGKALKLGGSTDYPGFGNLALGDEWTILVIAKGTDTPEAMIITVGNGHGRGSRAIGLAGTGKGGVKLVTWFGGKTNENKLLAMKDVVHFSKQFHTYAIVKGQDGKVSLWVDGKKGGESDSDISGLSGDLRMGAFHWVGQVSGLALGEGVEIDDLRVYDTALAEVQLLQIAGGNAPWPEGLPKPKDRISAYIDTNSVLRLGYEIPEHIVIGEGGEKRLYAKGVLAQCGIGGEKKFELRPGGQFALGGDGMVFDSNYARGRTNEVVFAGGALAVFEPSMIKSAAPIKLEGSTKIITAKSLAVRASMEGPGDIFKGGAATLGLQYPCSDATGKLTIGPNSTLVLGPSATWGGTIELMKGASLKCVSKNQVKNLVAPHGTHVTESNPERTYGDDVFPQPTTAYNFKKMQKERMGRGVYAVRQTADEVMVGWRYRMSDPTNVAFNVYANGVKLNSSPIRDVTYFKTPWKGVKTKYEVRWVLGDREAPSPVSSCWTLPADAPVGYFDIELTPPTTDTMPPSEGQSGAQICGHYPCDATLGDVDGDGEYELVIIWWPEKAGDNSSWHLTGRTWIEAVKLDGTNRSLWKIDLGPNIRSGSHYVPVMVCDMDGDGKAEVVCRTADGSRDAQGNVIGEASMCYRGRTSHILWAHNFVTVFDGATGTAMDSVPFKPDVLESNPDLREKMRMIYRNRSMEIGYKDNARNDPKSLDSIRLSGEEEGFSKQAELAVNREWSSRNPGNQAFRMLGAVAYLDGAHPSVVMCRGYYSRTCLTAYDLEGGKLKERWYFCSDDQRWWGYGGQGFHNLRVGDVDFDGKDEIIYGHMVVDHNGDGLHTTGGGHGDAIHLLQPAPDQRGLKLWSCHESARYGVSLWDAQTGRVLLHRDGPQDTGSCNAMDIDPAMPGMELFSGTHCGIYSASTLQQHPNPRPRDKDSYYSTLRFGIWWMGDMTRSAYSGGTKIKGYSVKERAVNVQADLTPDEVHSNHSTKGCPVLAADIFGDWREELLLTRNDNKAVRVFMSPEDTPYRFWTFLEDPTYRISVLTQNNGYNMPSDPGFYFGPDLLGHGIWFRGTYLK